MQTMVRMMSLVLFTSVLVLGVAPQAAHAKVMVAVESPHVELNAITPVADDTVANLAAELAAGEAVVQVGKGGQLRLVKVSATLAALGFAAGDVIVSVDGTPLRKGELPARLSKARTSGAFVVQRKRGKVTSDVPFAFGASSAMAASDDAPGAPASNLAVRDLGGGKVEVKRGDLMNVLGAGGAARSVRVVPNMRDSKPAGMKLYAIRPGSAFARLGFQNGDTIQSINGVTIASAEQMVAVHESMKTAKQLIIQVERRGAPATITIVLVD